VTTDTVPIRPCDKVEIVEVAPLFADVIRRLVLGGSIHELFK
jgi:phosphoribosylpyrophosphate synthetase